jgi:hypothetical protein
MAYPSLHAPRMPRGSNQGPAICHPERKAYCKRLCQVCYIRERQKARERRASCHPDRPHYAKGLCRNCNRSASRRSWPEARKKAHNRRNGLRRNFGLTPGDVDRMLADQGGVCAICSGGFDGHRWKQPCVDHCHATGKVRALLCFRCNSGLGYYEKYAHQFAAYLEKHK